MKKAKFRYLKKIVFIVFMCIENLFSAKSQPTAGTTGLLNIPSAKMQQDGTFMVGTNYLPEIITPESFDYNTGNYYLNITFLPFLEVNYKMTLFNNNGKYNRQDRSFAVRLRLLKEGHVSPSVVLGTNDAYTSAENSNQYFGSMYTVATKHFQWSKNKLGITTGYGFTPFRHNNYIGLFGGLSYSPYFFNQMNLILEYDSKYFNIGSSITVLKHVHLMAFTCDFKEIVGGISYKVYLE